MKTKILTLLVAGTGLLLSGCAEWDWQRQYQPSHPAPNPNKTTTTTKKTVKRERVRLPVEENDADETTHYEGLM
jgi:hypothetical protein